MRRNGYIVLLVAALAWAVPAIVRNSPTLGVSGTSASAEVTSSKSSPTCLPASLEHSASLTGTDVDVSPAPGSATADPHTQISFLGTSAANVSDVSATGSRSGDPPRTSPGLPPGRRRQLPPRRAVPGGRARRRARGDPRRPGRRQVAFSFHVDSPYPTASVPEFPNPSAAPADYQSFATLPGLQAPILSVTVPDRDPGGRRHPHHQRARSRPVRAADLHAPRVSSCGSNAPWRRDGRGPQRADLRRPARPHVVEGPGALARLWPGRRHRHELQLPDRRQGRAPATGCRRICTTSRSPPATSPTSPPTTRSAAISPRQGERATAPSSTRPSRRST